MSQDRQLMDLIKANFARKSSAQLQEIVQTDHQERWSPEAIDAASEVLRERLAGRAQEPQTAEQEPSPPPYHYEPEEVALGALFGLLTGYVVIPYYRRRAERPDLPAPFGPRMAWLAVETVDTAAVAAALGLQEAREATWAVGIDAAYRSSLFVTPPLGDWTLAVAAALFPPNQLEAFVRPLLERLSRQFGEAQYFCTHQDVELHAWARARKGRLIRGYGWLGQKRLTLWDEGAPTKEERDLGFRFIDEQSITTAPAPRANAPLPDEEGVMQLASLWSIDPTALDGQFKEPLMGLVGRVAAVKSREDAIRGDVSRNE